LFAVAAVFVMGVSSPVASQGRPWLPSLRDSTDVTSPDSVVGRIVDSRGAPIASGTQVILVAYPRVETLAALHEGDSFEPVTIAKGITVQDGRYVLRVDRSIDLSPFASETGNIDVMVRAVRGRNIATSYLTTTPAALQPTATADRTAGSTAGGASPTVIDLAAMVGTAALDEVHPTNPRSVVKTDICGETLVKNLGQMQTNVGQSYSTSSGSFQHYITQSGTSSTLGVGFSTTGGYGSFKTSGTVTRSHSDLWDYGRRSGWFRYIGWFSYGKYEQWCYPVYGDYAHRSVYANVARAITGGQNGGVAQTLGSAPSVPDSYCRPLGPGTSTTKATSVAHSFGTGVEISSVIGIDLSSRTGYSTNISLESKNTGTFDKKLCGTDGYYGDTPGMIRIK
jgi:hypothetical protein